MMADREMLADIERDEQWLAGLLDATPLPSPETLDRVQQVVGVELQRDWVGRFEHPTPDEATMARVRAAVDRELGQAPKRAMVWHRWRVAGVVSAAACVLITMGLVWYLKPVRSTPTPKPDARRDPGAYVQVDRRPSSEVVEDMTVAFQSVWEQRNPALLILAEEIGRLSTSALADEIDPMDSALRAIGDEIENLSAEWRQPFET
jgi:hypothetical protein